MAERTWLPGALPFPYYIQVHRIADMGTLDPLPVLSTSSFPCTFPAELLLPSAIRDPWPRRRNKYTELREQIRSERVTRWISSECVAGQQCLRSRIKIKTLRGRQRTSSAWYVHGGTSAELGTEGRSDTEEGCKVCAFRHESL